MFADVTLHDGCRDDLADFAFDLAGSTFLFVCVSGDGVEFFAGVWRRLASLSQP